MHWFTNNAKVFPPGVSTAYIGLDVHSRTSGLAWMNEDGNYPGPATFRTSGENLRQSVGQVEAEEKALILEEGPLAFWWSPPDKVDTARLSHRLFRWLALIHKRSAEEDIYLIDSFPAKGLRQHSNLSDPALPG